MNDTLNRIIIRDAMNALKQLPDECIDCCVTSPPYYGLRDYGVPGQIGIEETPEIYIEKLVTIFREVRRVLKNDGTLWVNIGDSYAGGAGRWDGAKNLNSKQASNKGSYGQIKVAQKWKHDNIKRKDLIGIPWTLALTLRADGWYLRQDIIWYKPNCMPESVKDRCTKSHEYIFMLSKSDKYYYDNEAIKEPCVSGDVSSPRGSKGTRTPNSARRKQDYYGISRYTGFNERCSNKSQPTMKNKRDVWSIPTSGYRGAHFATFPEKLVEPCILAGSRKGGVVLDPFFGSGTTAVVATNHGRNYIGIELNPDYVELAKQRLSSNNSQISF